MKLHQQSLQTGILTPWPQGITRGGPDQQRDAARRLITERQKKTAAINAAVVEVSDFQIVPIPGR